MVPLAHRRAFQGRALLCTLGFLLLAGGCSSPGRERADGGEALSTARVEDGDGDPPTEEPLPPPQGLETAWGRIPSKFYWDQGEAATGEPTPDSGEEAVDAGEESIADAGEELPPPPDAGFALFKVYSEHVGKLTGTAQNPVKPLGMLGTDLGVSFERDGQLVFLFGDSYTPTLAGFDDDTIATTPLPSSLSSGTPTLSWLTTPSGGFLPLHLAGVNLLTMNVPVEAVPQGPLTYVFFSTGWSKPAERHTHSVLAHMDGLDVPGLVVDHVEPTTRFINVSVVEDAGTCWIYGSGAYRTSAIYLAKVSCTQLADRGQWQYYDAWGQFSYGENSAWPFLDENCVGELSVRHFPAMGAYLMAYGCGSRGGIQLRWSTRPEGPFSEPMNIFDTWADQGYLQFAHAREVEVGFDDGLSNPGEEHVWGATYAPYLIPQLSESQGGVHSIAWTVSTWNPYQVHLMRTVLVEPSATASAPSISGPPSTQLVNADFSNGFDGWQQSGDSFAVIPGVNGQPFVTTYVTPQGDAVTGELWQDFVIGDDVSELSFRVSGGNARVELVVGGEVVRASRGRKALFPERPVAWQIARYRGQSVRLRIVDDLTGPWGFVSVSGFELN